MDNAPAPAVNSPVASPTSSAAAFPAPAAAASPPNPTSTNQVAVPSGPTPATENAQNAVTDPNTHTSGAMNSSGMYGGYGGMMDPYGMGMGGYGMGMGGLGMMGMGGLGMMGMGMTPEAQRAQVMMFMMSRIVELWGMFSQVVQTTFGSATQYVSNSNGIRQAMSSLESECLQQERAFMAHEKERAAALKDVPPEALAESKSKIVVRPRHLKVRKNPSLARRIGFTILRHSIFLVLSMFFARRIQSTFLKS